MSELADLLKKTLAAARQAGADDAEVHLSESSHFSVLVRHSGIEKLSQATTRSLHLRVFVGQRLARASASDLGEDTLHGLVRRAVARARLANEDPFAGLPDDFPTPPSADELRLYDPQVESVTAEEGIEMARETERIALGLDSRVQNSGGASFHKARGQIWLANTRGFRGNYHGTSTSLGLYLLGQEGAGNAQVADYWYSAGRQRAQLESAEHVARTAVERVRRHFGARKVATQEVPVIFEPVLAAELLSDIFGAVCGEAVYLQRSFLAGALGHGASEGVLHSRFPGEFENSQPVGAAERGVEAVGGDDAGDLEHMLDMLALVPLLELGEDLRIHLSSHHQERLGAQEDAPRRFVWASISARTAAMAGSMSLDVSTVMWGRRMGSMSRRIHW